jgi:hypothetical protein
MQKLHDTVLRNPLTAFVLWLRFDLVAACSRMVVARVGQEDLPVQAEASSSAVTLEESLHTRASTLVLARSKRATLPGSLNMFRKPLHTAGKARRTAAGG